MGRDNTLIVGCGYLGHRVARLLLDRGDQVVGTTRSVERAEALAAMGIEPLVVDVMDGDSLAKLPAADRVLYCVGFDRLSEHSLRSVYVDGLRKTLGRLYERAGHLVYASSTGVYGQDDGGWVDESSPTGPRTDSGRACLDAEGVVRNYAAEVGLRAAIVRFAGLYGPGRIIRRAAIERGEPIAGDPDKYLNMIHVDDAAAAAVAALDRGESGGIYLACDDRPATRREFYGLTAELLGAPAPQFDVAGAGPEESNKRVSNRRMRDVLGVVLRYPDYTKGLPAALAGDRAG